MKKAVQFFYIAVFVVLLALPAVFFRTVGKHLVDSANYENRRLAPRPVLSISLESIQSFPAAFESYFKDALPFRNQLGMLSGLIDYRIFRSTASDTVIIGKDGWLFYKGSQANGEDPIADYQGTNLFSQEELQQIAANVMQMKADFAAQGVEQFVVMLCPNKERAYADQMPEVYGALTPYGRLEQVTDYLRQNTDVPVVNAYESLREYRILHPETQLYFKYDTHWNHKGAFLGAYALNTQLGIHDIPPLEALAVDEGPIPVYDLARLLHLGNVLKDDPAETLRGYTLHSIEMTTDDTSTVFSYNNPAMDGDPRNVMMIGDSFSSMLSLYVAANFNHMYDTFYYKYSPEDLQREKPDVVVYETVERYMANLGRFSVSGGISVTD